MTLQDFFAFLLVFLTGVFIGVVVYVTSFQPIYAPDNLQNDEAIASEFSIIGKAYGGDQGSDYIRPSFRLLGNGQYDYLPGGSSSVALEPESGTLPKGLLREIKKAADLNLLADYEEPVSKDNCMSFEGGFDYEYLVVVDKQSFDLHTCFSALDYSDDLAVALIEVWNYLDDPENSKYSRLLYGESLNEWMSDWLASQLDPNYGKE